MKPKARRRQQEPSQPERRPEFNAGQGEIYRRIEAFRFDEGGTALTFVSRLERDNGWSRAYALRALTEYRRFVFLAAVAGHPVSPSDPVDQVWHLHLLYTHSYWERFCRQTLGQPLHHQPSKGGKQEREKFAAWYAATLESYRRYFGEQPPPDIWPGLDTKLGEGSRFERVDRKRYHLISRARMRLASATGAAILALFLLLHV